MASGTIILNSERAVIGMHEHLAAIAKHGYLVLLAWMIVAQLGAPVPAIPILIGAGVLCAAGQLRFASALLIAILGCLLGDGAWYVIGRRRGSDVLRVLCKISLNPATCVRRGSEFISRHGNRGLVVAKFIPGVSTVAVPLAASSGSPPWLFFYYDFLGSLLFVGTFLVAGRLLGNRIDRLSIFAGSIRAVVLGFAVIAALGLLGWRYYQKRRFQNELNVARITPEELLELIETRQAPYIVDLRHPLDMLADPRMIPGAIRMTPDELSARQREIPRDREIVLYCT